MKNTKTLLSILLLFAITLFAVSCAKEGPVYEKYLQLKNSSWDRFDQKLIEIPPQKTDNSCDITLVVRCTEQFQDTNFPLYVILTSPSGEEQIREVSLPVRENGKLITRPDETKPEARIILWKNIILGDKGMSKISIENMIPRIQTRGIDEIGIVVTTSK